MEGWSLAQGHTASGAKLGRWATLAGWLSEPWAGYSGGVWGAFGCSYCPDATLVLVTGL